MAHEAYPITHRFEEENRQFGGNGMFRLMSETIGEYEHGSADVTDVHPNLTVEMYAAVCADLIQIMHVTGEGH